MRRVSRVLGLALLLACSGTSGPSYEQPEVTWEEHLRAGRRMVQSVRYAQAERHYQQSLAAIEQGPRAPAQRAMVRLAQAQLLQLQGRSEESYAAYSQLVDELRGAGDPQYGNAVAGLGSVLIDMDRHAEALPWLQESLAIRLRALGPDHVSVGVSFHNLGEAHAALGHFAEAEVGYQRALAIYGASGLPVADRASTSLNGLGKLYRASGDLKRSEQLHQQAIQLSEKTGGRGNVNQAIFSRSLAELYLDQGRDPEAEALLRDSLRWLERGFGPSHPEVQATREILRRFEPESGP